MNFVRTRRWTVALVLVLALVLPAAAVAAPGSLTQLNGKRGCVVDSAVKKTTCAKARALRGPGPFMGSRALALSPDGRNLYVASSKSDAVAIFTRNLKTGVLTQARNATGCVAASGSCAKAIGLDEPNSVAVSPNGRTVYVTSRAANSVTAFARNSKTGALRQLPPSYPGCISSLPIPGCVTGLALVAPDVVVASADGKNVYVGSFFGNSVAAFSRNDSGALTQLPGTAACIAEATEGCTSGIGLLSVEGLAISGDGNSVYAGTALSNAVVTLARDPSTGALTQPAGGCIVDSPLTGCTTGVQLAGANAVAVSPDGNNVYATSLFSNSVASFNRSSSTGALEQKGGTAGCLVYLRAVGCSFGRALVAPEGLAISPDGRNVYVAAFQTGALDVLFRGKAGAVAQLPGTPGCLGKVAGCTQARALKGVSSVAVSPDGRFVYSTSFESNAVNVFRRNK